MVEGSQARLGVPRRIMAHRAPTIDACFSKGALACELMMGAHFSHTHRDSLCASSSGSHARPVERLFAASLDFHLLTPSYCRSVFHYPVF